MKKSRKDKDGKPANGLTRRQILKAGLIGAGAALFWHGDHLYGLIGGKRVALAQIPGGSLNPAVVPKYVTSMLVPPSMPRAGILWDRNLRKFVDYYEISMKQFPQQILPPTDTSGQPLNPTTVWGYGPVRTLLPGLAKIYNAPSLTIEADAGRPVRIKWINDLKDAGGSYLPHLLPVDPTLHWANPPGGTVGRDTRPTFGSTPGRYTGPVPMVTHVHGAVGVGDESDGYAEAWYLPNDPNIDPSYAKVGTWYDFFAAKANSKFGATWGPGYAVFQYPNLDRASTNWYHDHTLGMTRLNVYAGPAGFYNIRGGPAGDLALRDSRNGRLALLPGPPPNEIDNVLSLFGKPNRKWREIPIAIQDRSFNTDGSLFYPDTRAFFDGITGDYIPDTDIAPIWNPEFFGNMMMVNGNTWPFLEVEQRRYRFRFLNGCDARFLILDFTAIINAGGAVWQIGNEGGFLAAPVNISAPGIGNKLLMGPAERADVIVDFTNVAVGSYVLGNVGPDEPFKGFNTDGTLADGEGGTLAPADPATTGKIMQFRVFPRTGLDLTTPPQYLVLPAITALPPATVTRPLALLEEMSMDFEDAPAETLLGIVEGDPNVAAGVWAKRLWMDPVTENPAVGATEVWEFYNATADAHPMHVHEVVFEVVNRQSIEVNEVDMTVRVTGSPTPPQPWETGFKDTVIAYPGQVTRIRAQFNTPGQFVWHCHIVEHEDNEMMRPYRIGPEQPGQPMPHNHGGGM